MDKQYIIINGRAYNTITGLPMDNIASQAAQQPQHEPSAISPNAFRGVNIKSIHQASLQTATTLSRRYTKAPAFIVKQRSAQSQPQSAAVARPDRSAASHPIAERVKVKQLDNSSPRLNRASQPHAISSRQQSALDQPSSAPKSAQMIKNEAINKVLQNEQATTGRRRAKKTTKSWFNWTSLASTGIAISLLGGYFTYLNMPNLSIKMAAIQSGVDAKYPGYKPSGYSLKGPIAFKDNEVSMKFAYADSDSSFTLKQEKSSWDSSTVKQFISQQAENPAVTSVDGLTIYSYQGNASWVNGGILYSLKGNAPLSSSQIQRIASSL